MNGGDGFEAGVLSLRPYSAGDEKSVIDLWDRCNLLRPWNDPVKDIWRKQQFNPEWFIVAILKQELAGTIMVGYEGHRGWVNYLAVDPSLRRQGIGRSLMKRAEELLATVGCPKVNLQVRFGNEAAAEFYLSLGYAKDEVISFGKRLDA
jgi:ribosomal protein S18 acetylase RimI-like enzyme